MFCDGEGRGGRGSLGYVVVKCPLPYYRVVVVAVAHYQILSALTMINADSHENSLH